MYRFLIPAILVGLTAIVMAQMTGPATAPSTQPTSVKTSTATFAAGCFWGVEATFRKVPGVVSTQVGFTGGKTEKPTYRQFCTNTTGHAEAVEIEFDPAKVTYEQLLNIFFENHDPTTADRQGPDIGGQYRSAIFFHTPEQEKAAIAEKTRREKSGDYAAPIVTQIVAAGPFYRAEEYHQQYYEKQGTTSSCHFGNGEKAPVGAHP